METAKEKRIKVWLKIYMLKKKRLVHEIIEKQKYLELIDIKIVELIKARKKEEKRKRK